MEEKGESYGTIYCLCNNIVTNHAVAMTLGNVHDVVILWHQCLGHMSEKGLKKVY